MKRTWIKNARIVNEGKIFHGSIVIENEVIAEVLAEDARKNVHAVADLIGEIRRTFLTLLIFSFEEFSTFALSLTETKFSCVI